MRDADHQVSRTDDRVAVPVLGGHVNFHRQPGPLLDRVAPDQSGVIGGAAGRDHHLVHASEHLIVDRAELSEIHPLLSRDALAERLGDRVRLLVDLLEHERLVALFLGRVSVPVDLDHVALDRLPAGGVELDALRPEHDDLVVVYVLDAARLAQKCGDRRADELLALAAADDQRALLARANQNPGLLGAHGHERVVAAEFRVRLTDCFDQAPLRVMKRDQVGNHLGIGLRGEHRTHVEQALLERQIVLDDAVDDDVDLVGGIEVRVRVLLADPAVRRPACVTDPRPGLLFGRFGKCNRGRLRASVQRRAQLAQVADSAHGIDPSSGEHGDTGAVVASILELLEAVKQQRLHVSGPHIPNDPAHARGLYLTVSWTTETKRPHTSSVS